MDLQEIQLLYVEKQQAIKKVEDRIEMREAQIQRLEKKKRKLEEKASWTENLIRPILELVKAKFPNIVWEDERLTPMGLCCRVWVFGRVGGTEDGKLVGIPFIPYDINNGILGFETDKVIEQFPKGSIGAMNGMGKETVVLKDIRQIYNLIQDKLQK